MQSQMSSVDFQGRARRAGAILHLVSGVRLLAALLVLSWALPVGDLSSREIPVSPAGATGSLDAGERAGERSLQPRALSGTILTEGRHQWPKREFSPDRNPPSALAPGPAPAPTLAVLEHLWPISQGQRQPTVVRAFEARGPPGIT